MCSLPEVQTDNSERAYGSDCPTGQAMADVGVDLLDFNGQQYMVVVDYYSRDY